MATVLVLDDFEDNRENAREALERMGHTVIEASTIPDALRVWDKGNVDAVLTDWQVGPKATVEQAKYSRVVVEEVLREGHIPVLIMSGTDDSSGGLSALRKKYRENTLLSYTPKDTMLEALTTWPPERR